MDPQEPQPELDPRSADRTDRAGRQAAAEGATGPVLFTPSSRRIRSGPIAAAIATVGILAVTALPAAAPSATPAPPAAKTLTTSPVEQVTASISMVTLGSPFGSLEPLPGAFIEGLDDGTERFTFELREKGAGPDAPVAFEGRVEFRRPIAADESSADDLHFFGPRETRLAGEPTLAPVESRADVLAGSSAFRAARGELMGLGEYAGIRLTLRTSPGTGVWCPGERRFAHLLWFRDATTFGHAVPDMGMAEIAFRRSRLR